MQHAVRWDQRSGRVPVPKLPVLKACVVDRTNVSLCPEPFLPNAGTFSRVSFGVFYEIVVHPATVHVQGPVQDVPLRRVDAGKADPAIGDQLSGERLPRRDPVRAVPAVRRNVHPRALLERLCVFVRGKPELVGLRVVRQQARGQDFGN